MSGIYIKGTEKPQNCHGCPLVDLLENCPCNKMSDHDFWDSALLEFAVHEDCPIWEVHDHGQLIDAEKIYDSVEQRYRMSSGIEHRCERDFLDLICAAPTVIPAESEEK